MKRRAPQGRRSRKVSGSISAKKLSLIVLAWTLLCGAMFLAVRQLDQPVPTAGFGHAEAESLALEILRERDARTYGDYIVINSASSETASPTGEKRWVVLCNRPSGGTTETAVIVELSRDGSELLGFRRPWQKELRTDLP